MTLTYRYTLRACYTGCVSQAIVNNLAPLLFVLFQSNYGLTFEQTGRLILLNFGVQILADLFAIRYADRLGHRLSLVLAHVLCGVGLLCLGLLPLVLGSPYLGLCIAVMLYAVGGGLLEVLVTPVVDSLPSEAKASSMSLLHASYCWGQVIVVLISTLFLSLLGNGLWFVLPLCWAALPLFNAFLFSRVPLLPPVPAEKRTSFGKLLRAKTFVVALVLMMCAGAAELTMSQWASTFAEKGLHVSKAVGDLLGPCLFAVFMGIGRTVHGVWGHKIRLRPAMLFCAVLCIVCYVTTVFAPIPALSLLGCSLCGLSVSLMWPGTISMTAAHFPMGGTAMFGLLAVMGDVGASLGPWLVGVVADISQAFPLAARFGEDPAQAGLKFGILAGTVFPLVLLLGILALREKKDNG